MRCQHCYADIREATITDDGPLTLGRALGRPLPSAWLTESTRSPFCIRDLCAAGGVVHEIKHAPMPVV
jgi:hypothetical protein